MKYFFGLIVLFLISGCAQMGQDSTAAPAAIPPTVVFEPGDSAYLLSCVDELQGVKNRDFVRYSKEAASRLVNGNDRDKLKYICLSLHSGAGAAQFRRGRELLSRYIKEHPESAGEMQGLMVLVSRLEKSRSRRVTGQKKLEEERDGLVEQLNALQLESKQDKAQIQELQRQINQLQNIENIIKNREQ